MQSFPATHELCAFTGSLLLFWLVVRTALRLWPLVAQVVERSISRISHFIRFPRALLHADVKVLAPFRELTLHRLLYRFKFTLFMFFLNVYTFLFTNDLSNGEIKPDVLESSGFSYMHFAQHKWFILVTSNFIHFHLPHLAVNMIMLLVFTGSLELLKGSRLTALVYLISMNSNVPNGLFLLPGLKILYPQIWSQTVQYVDVGASLGIIGTLGGLARLLVIRARYFVMAVAVVGALVGALYIHNLFGIDHAFSALIGYLTADYLLKKTQAQSTVHDSDFEKKKFKQAA